MIYITTHLSNYSPKNRACAELTEWVKSFEYIIIKDELSLDALKEEFRHKVAELNEKYPKVKKIEISVERESIRANVRTNGIPEEIFILNYHKVKSTYAFSESIPEGNSQLEKGGSL